jgi:hypothetical protein
MTQASRVKRLYENHLLKCVQCRDADERLPGAGWCPEGLKRRNALDVAQEVARARRRRPGTR